MVATNEDIYRELIFLRSEIRDLKNLLIPGVEPQDEPEAIRKGKKEFKAVEYIDWRV